MIACEEMQHKKEEQDAACMHFFKHNILEQENRAAPEFIHCKEKKKKQKKLY
jgi:hypothetical protein